MAASWIQNFTYKNVKCAHYAEHNLYLLAHWCINDDVKVQII